jgi:hypothetical protein
MQSIQKIRRYDDLCRQDQERRSESSQETAEDYIDRHQTQCIRKRRQKHYRCDHRVKEKERGNTQNLL